MRWLVGSIGTAVTAYGVWLLLSRQSFDQLLDVAVWLAAGVVLHDGVLSGAVVLLGLIGMRLPRAVGAAAAFVMIVLGSITVVALPALVHSRTPGGNPTLLPRDYPLGWVLVAIVVLLGGAVVGWAARRRTKEEG